MISAAMLVLAQTLTPAAQTFVDNATNRLIAGEELAPDFPVNLQALTPDERLLVIVHLRRAGFLGDVVMPVDWILSPATAERAAAEPQR